MQVVTGLYAVTPDEADTFRLAEQVEAALAGGARLLQYRNKTATRQVRHAQARTLLALCRRHGVPLLINDDIDLALATGADGVHLGQEDGPYAAARARLGSGRLIGVSCYGDLQRALDAEKNGASYAAFGSFFASTIKPGAVRPPLALLEEARRRLTLPVVAIGGITSANAPQLIAAGADSIAVISALFSAPDIRGAAAGLSALFARSHGTASLPREGIQ